MQIRLSPQCIEALATVISGGSANDSTPSIGLYRSGPQLERFMRGCGIDFSVGSNSRLPALADRLSSVAHGPDAERLLQNVIEKAADPRDFVQAPEKLTAVINYLNAHLKFDGLEVISDGSKSRLIPLSGTSKVVEKLASGASNFEMDTVSRDLERALASAATDPEDAVTAACSLVESVCRSILVELGVELPSKKDIASLYRAVREPLGIAPDRSDIPKEVLDDVRKVLSGLTTVVEGIGGLRTHGGDAHGRERGYRRIDPRIAALSIHAASTVALFLIETWQQKFPTKPLRRH